MVRNVDMRYAVMTAIIANKGFNAYKDSRCLRQGPTQSQCWNYCFSLQNLGEVRIFPPRTVPFSWTCKITNTEALAESHTQQTSIMCRP